MMRIVAILLTAAVTTVGRIGPAASCAHDPDDVFKTLMQFPFVRSVRLQADLTRSG